MKPAYLIFILLISFSNCIQRVYRNDKTPLTSSDMMFYLDSSSYSSTGYIYLYFEGKYYYVDSLKVCFTNTDPYYNTPSCTWLTESYTVKITTGEKNQYLYNFKVQSGSYIVCKYSGYTSPPSYSSSLTVQASESDIFNLVKALSTIAIICIAVGVAVVIIVSIIIICCCCACCHAAASTTYVNPQPIIYANPAVYPLTANNY